MSQKQRKQTPAQRRAEEALDQIAKSSSQPTKKVLDFLLAGTHDAPKAPTPQPVPNPDQTQPSPNPGQSQTAPRPAKLKLPVAPERDFNRRANSLERVALPAGVFPGASKKLYDSLYIRTRGAVKPARTVQATRRELMQWSGIRNIKTINVHVRRLGECGLIKHVKARGDHEGSLYEVFLPEEADPDPTQTSARPDPNRKTVSDQDQKTVWVGSGNPLENKDTSSPPKTSFNTNTENDDDEAFAGLVGALRKASAEITGKEPSKADASRWQELADVLVAELKIAAARTTISSVPSFMAEHLRRRLWKIDKKQAKAEGRELPDEKTTSVQNKEARTCPDCGGSGWWYPDGLERGVAKCKHSNLKKET